MALILDTNAVSALLTGDRALETLLLSSIQLCLPTVVLGEYRYGLLRSNRRRELSFLLHELILVSKLLDVDEPTTRAYAQIRDELRRIGRPIPANDLWIAAITRRYERALVSRDRHFDYVDGIQRLEW